MKAIKLSAKQEKKLLEMAQKLFPKYKNIYWNSGKGSNGSSEHLGFGVPNKETSHFIDYTYIHWFEFCVIKLSKKIFEKMPENVQDDLLEDNWFDRKQGAQILICNYFQNHFEEHVVDYLYKEFKQLKLK